MTDPIARALSERAWTAHVVALAQACGYRVTHFRAARTAVGWRTALSGDRGAPDLLLAGGTPPRVLHVELKRAGVRVADPAQRAWLDALARAGALVAVWRPEDREAVLDYLAGSDPRALPGRWTGEKEETP